jgi:pimeloyl-ACP methyl ester carboxylesterase
MAAAVVLKSHLAGYSTIRPQPRGIGGSTGPMNGLSLRDLAADAMAAADDGPIIVIGHDYGQRVARMTFPDRVPRGAGAINPGGLEIRSPLSRWYCSDFFTVPKRF